MQSFLCRDVTDADRQNIFDDHWELGSWDRKCDLICSTVKQFGTNDNTKRRSNFKQYFIPVKGEHVRVCQVMYRNTFSNGVARINTAMAHKTSSGTCNKQNTRLGNEPPNKTAQCDIDIVHEHISCFPVVESHYCRASSSKLYLPAELKNVSFVYKLYKSYCLAKNVTPVSMYVYT